MSLLRKPPRVLPRQTWRFERQEGAVTRILPGGAGDLGIAEFDGPIHAAHVSTMLKFSAWAFVAEPPIPFLPDIDSGDGPPVGG